MTRSRLQMLLTSPVTAFWPPLPDLSLILTCILLRMEDLKGAWKDVMTRVTAKQGDCPVDAHSCPLHGRMHINNSLLTCRVVKSCAPWACLLTKRPSCCLATFPYSTPSGVRHSSPSSGNRCHKLSLPRLRKNEQLCVPWRVPFRALLSVSYSKLSPTDRTKTPHLRHG